MNEIEKNKIGGIIKTIGHGILSKELVEIIREYPDIGIQVSKSGDSYTVQVTKPDCMEVIGDDIWMLRPPAKRIFKWLYMDKAGPLFVRKCDREMCEKVIFPTILENPNCRRGKIIMGTPGIGKSVLTNWVIAMIRSYFKDKDIYLFDSSRDLRYLIQRNGWCFRITEKYYDDAVMDDKNAIVLIDAGGRRSFSAFKHAGFAMVTASSKVFPKEMAKGTFFSKGYLSVWNWEDVEATFDVLFPIPTYLQEKEKSAQYEELERRYAFAGGVPKILFGDLDLADVYENDVDFAIKKAVLKIDPYISFKDNEPQIFHFHPEDRLFLYKFKFATDRVEIRFYESMRTLDFDQFESLMWSMIGTIGSTFMSQAGARVIFEVVVHHMLSSSFLWRQKDIEWKMFGPTENIDVAEVEENRDYSEFDASEIHSYQENTYYAPTRATQVGIVSWMKKGNELYLFQITKQPRSHVSPAENNLFQNIRNEQNDIEIRYVYVVPKVPNEIEMNYGMENKENVSIGLLKVNVLGANVDSRWINHLMEWAASKEDQRGQESERKLSDRNG